MEGEKMNIFINSDVMLANEILAVQEGERTTKLNIPKSLETREYVEITLPVTFKELKWGILVTDVKLADTEKGYNFVKTSENINSNECYMLISSRKTCPSGDVWVAREFKDKVEVLEKMKFYDFEVDYGTFEACIYLVKLALKNNESMAFFLTHTQKSKNLERCIVINNSGKMFTQKEKRQNNKEITENYISLKEI